ncbi:MAG: hypothetical protein ACRDS0_13700 [Pseudonocardiaceae bacterium]
MRDKENPDPEVAMGWWGWVIVAVVVVLLLIALAVLLQRRRRRGGVIGLGDSGVKTRGRRD